SSSSPMMVLYSANEVLRLPSPGNTSHIHQVLLCLPAQTSSALGRICIAGSQLAGASLHDLIRNLHAVGLFKCLDHIQHAVTNTGAQVEHFAAQVFHRVLHRGNVTLGQVYHMDVVPDAGAVVGVIVIAKDAEFLPAAHSHL